MLKEILQRLSSLRGWIDGVCITGGEPTLQFDLPNLVQEIKRHGFLIKLDTNGSHPEMLRELIQMKVIDFISMDVKAPLDPISYQRSVGIHFDINLILRSIEILKREEVEYQFRMTVVPQIHREEDIKLLGQQLKAGRRFVLQNFNPKDPLDPSLKNTPPFDPKRLREIEEEVQKMV
jgi:pyruvate formate lyase activating enzyme